MAERLFISYSSRDQPLADAIYDYMKAQGLRPWMASRNIPPAKDYANHIVMALRQSELVLLVLTPNTNASAQVPLELNLAKTRHLPILPVRCQPFEFSATLQYFLGASQWFNAIAQPFEQHLPQIFAKARELLDGVDAGTFSTLQAALEALTPADIAPMRDAIRWGQRHALITRLKSKGDPLESTELRLGIEQDCRRFAQRLGVDDVSGADAEVAPAAAQTAAAGAGDTTSIVTASQREADLIALGILVRYGLRVASGFTLSFRLNMAGLYLQNLAPTARAQTLAGLTKLAEDGGLPLIPIERLAMAVQGGTSVDDSAVAAVDEMVTTLEDYALYRRAIALQRASLWEFGRKVSLLTIAYAEGASEPILRHTRAQMRVFAAALKFEVPPIRVRSEDPSHAGADALHYLMHDIGRGVGPKLHDLYGERFSALLECSLKSSMLFMLYSEDDPGDQTTTTLVSAIERSARAAALPSETWLRVPELVRQGAPFEEVKEAVRVMQSRVADYLHRLAGNATL